MVSPQHAYGQTGTFVVSLVVRTDCGSDTLTDTVQVDQLLGRPAEIPQVDLAFYPSPSQGLLHIEGTVPQRGEIQLEVLELAGRLVATRSWQTLTTQVNQTFRFADLPPGVYVLRLRTQDRTITRKWILE